MGAISHLSLESKLTQDINLAATDFVDPDDRDNNTSGNPHLNDVLALRMHRRHVLKGGVGAMTMAGLGTLGLTACGGGSDSPAATPGPALNFSAVARATTDRVTVPAGYTATVIFATGDSLSNSVSDYKNDGTDGNCILWIETDDNTFTDQSNAMLLAAVPGTTGDGGQRTVVNASGGSPVAAVNSAAATTKSVVTYAGKPMNDTIFKRFLTAPTGAEVTGVTESPDGTALFINIQHPGENTSTSNFNLGIFESNWPANGGGVTAYGAGGASGRPRSTTVMITKNDGGIIGL